MNRMAVRKLARSWQFDFTLEGHGRHRKGGFRTKVEALEAERQRRSDLIAGRKRFSFAEAYEMYMSATHMKALSRDHWERCWPDIKPILGHLFIEEVDTLAMDRLRNSLPKGQAPSSRNHRLSLVRTILRFMWKRGLLAAVPYVPMESVPEAQAEWYTEDERGRFLEGMFHMQPRWYTFFYLTTRLGLRTGEVYAISKGRIRDIPPQLIIDRAVQRGTKERPALLGPRKSNQALTLALTADVIDAIRWHIRQSYAGEEFLFSPDGHLPGSPRQPQTATPGRAAGPRAPGAEPSPDRPPLGDQPSRHRRPVHQGDPSAARPSLGAEHGGLRPPRSTGAAPISRGVTPRCATSCQRRPIAKIGSAASPRND